MTVSDRARIRTHPERAVPDEAEEILEKGLLAHVGFVVDGQPFVIPMLYHYEDDIIYIHGQRGGRLPRTLRAGDQVCVETTLVDGLIASRDALYHSANYRSAVAFGTAREVTDRAEKEAVLERMTRRYFPGRTVGEHYRGAERQRPEHHLAAGDRGRGAERQASSGTAGRPGRRRREPGRLRDARHRAGLPDRRGRPRRVASGWRGCWRPRGILSLDGRLSRKLPPIRSLVSDVP